MRKYAAYKNCKETIAFMQLSIEDEDTPGGGGWGGVSSAADLFGCLYSAAEPVSSSVKLEQYVSKSSLAEELDPMRLQSSQ